MNNLKVLSDKIDDVTTVENILKSFIKPGMSDAERARRCGPPPSSIGTRRRRPTNSWRADWEAHDPVKIFNVYGYCMCCCCSSLIEALNRLDGRAGARPHPQRPQRAGGLLRRRLAHVRLLADHLFPQARQRRRRLGRRDLRSARRLVRQEPRLPRERRQARRLHAERRLDGLQERSRHCWRTVPSTSSAGSRRGRTAGTPPWPSTTARARCTSTATRSATGRCFRLRPGESSVARGGQSRPARQRRQPSCDVLKAKAPQNDLVYLKKFSPATTAAWSATASIAMRRTWPPAGWRRAPSATRTWPRRFAGAASEDGGKPGVAVVALTSPYVYLGGRLKLKAVRKTDGRQGGGVAVHQQRPHASRRCGRPTKSAAVEATVDLNDSILRRYAYWLKIEITSASPTGAGLEEFAVENDIQHAPRTLPWLGKGRNTITVAADGDAGAWRHGPIACRITPDAKFAKQRIDRLDGRDVRQPGRQGRRRAGGRAASAR